MVLFESETILTGLLPEWSDSKLSCIIGKYVFHLFVSFTTKDQIFWQWVIKALAYFVGFVKHSLSSFSEIFETFPISLFGATDYKSVLPLECFESDFQCSHSDDFFLKLID